MKNIIKTAGAALALTASAGIAVAAPQHEVVGKIEHLNPRKHQLTLKHQIYRYDPRSAGVSLRVGEPVKIIYRNAHGHRIAEKIWPA
jgi:hypothetical protein